jgi:hypothetical protein
VDRGDPAIAAALNRLDKDGVVGGIAKCVAEAVDRAADAVIEIHEHAFRPECLAKLIPAEHLLRPAEQESQSPERQILNLDLDAVLAEFSRVHIGLEHAEANDCSWLSGWLHTLLARNGGSYSLAPLDFGKNPRLVPFHHHFCPGENWLHGHGEKRLSA